MKAALKVVGPANFESAKSEIYIYGRHYYIAVFVNWYLLRVGGSGISFGFLCRAVPTPNLRR